jgi:hypothetical protein
MRTFEQRKQIGWKIKKDVSDTAKLRDAIHNAFDDMDYSSIPSSVEELRKQFSFNPAGKYPFSFAVNSTVEERLIKCCLLHELFEPVYDNTGMKCVGYKTPVQLFSGTISEGTIYYTCPWHGFYMPKGMTNADNYKLPKEIVETWEPVYKPEEIELYIGGGSSIAEKATKVIIGPGKIIAEDGNDLSISDIMGLAEDVKSIISKSRIIDGSKRNYPVNYHGLKIKVGCTDFSADDLFKVVEAFKKINK